MQNFIVTIVTNPSQYTLDETIVNKIFRILEKQSSLVSGFSWLSVGEACDITLQAPSEKALREALLVYLADKPVDSFIQEKSEQRLKKLLISDMDSTIIEQECIDELADSLGIKPQVADITAKAMNGELDFPSALKERVALLKGLEESILQSVFENKITFMPGAKTLIATMNKLDTRCVLVSGGFTFFTQRVAKALGFAEHQANQLDFHQGKLTGKVIEPILDKEAKVEALEAQIAQLGITGNDVLALGDGANDLPMLERAALGIACHAKDAVKRVIHHQVNHTTLESVLFAQGIKREEFVL
jgi:phosphoserine phosphatase